MRNSESPKEDGAVKHEVKHPDLHSLGEHGRQIHKDAAALVADVRGSTIDLERYLSTQVRVSPYRSLGIAAGVGYLLGGGLTSRLTLLLLGVATRLAAGIAIRELGSQRSRGTMAPSKSTRAKLEVQRSRS